MYINRNDIPEKDIEHEKKVLLDQALEQGSANLEIAQKKVDGRLRKFYEDMALLDQPYCLEDDSKFTIEKLIKTTSKELNGLNIKVSQMVVLNLGQQSEGQSAPE